MGEGEPRGEGAATGREAAADAGSSGWVTTQQAAKALDVSPRTVRWHIERGNLEAKPEGEGVQRAWLVSIDSLQVFRDSRQAAASSPRDYRAAATDADTDAAILGNPIRELADRLAEEAARAAEYRVRLELTERAESTLREELADERRRREEAERERDDLRRRIEGREEDAPESPESPVPTPSPQTGTEAPREASERPWWRFW